MKILILATDEIVELSDSYAARLVEQGRAVLATASRKPAAAKTEEKPAGKSRKG